MIYLYREYVVHCTTLCVQGINCIIIMIIIIKISHRSFSQTSRNVAWEKTPWGASPALGSSFVMTFLSRHDKFVLSRWHVNAHIASEVCIYHLASHLMGASHLEKQTAG